jgi:hypothetical protein
MSLRDPIRIAEELHALACESCCMFSCSAKGEPPPLHVGQMTMVIAADESNGKLQLAVAR